MCDRIGPLLLTSPTPYRLRVNSLSDMLRLVDGHRRENAMVNNAMITSAYPAECTVSVPLCLSSQQTVWWW